jgi:CHAD domain-containing protein
MVSRVVRPAGPIREDLLHQYRKTIKRARYTAEFAPKSAEAALFITQAKKLQEALGNWRDWSILTEAAADRLGDVNQSSLVALLHNVTGGKFRQALAAVSASPLIPAINSAPVSRERSRAVSTKTPTLVERIQSAA